MQPQTERRTLRFILVRRELLQGVSRRREVSIDFERRGGLEKIWAGTEEVTALCWGLLSNQLPPPPPASAEANSAEQTNAAPL